jgi:predicted Zn-dependent protease with MMP-like domain
MEVSLIVIDDFYNDPDKVREFALEQEFTVTGNYPGLRTKSFWTPDIGQAIERVMPFCGKIVDTFGAENGEGYTGAFQVATARDRTWIHTDHNNMWSAVLYLSPNPPPSAGTGLFRYKRTGVSKDPDGSKMDLYDGMDITKWDLVDRIGNKYNRLVIYRGDLFHASLDYFGKDLRSGRLFQTFFFNTEKWL